VAEDTVIDEPERRVTEKLLALTVIDCTALVVPLTLSGYPPTVIIALVVKLRSLYAANMTLGAKTDDRANDHARMCNDFLIINS
jgi:hypothetical protein